MLSFDFLFVALVRFCLLAFVLLGQHGSPDSEARRSLKGEWPSSEVISDDVVAQVTNDHQRDVIRVIDGGGQ